MRKLLILRPYLAVLMLFCTIGWYVSYLVNHDDQSFVNMVWCGLLAILNQSGEGNK